MAHEIDTAAKRAKLPVRPAPFFYKIAPGKSLGFRTTSKTWIARLHKPGQKRRHHPIGHESELDFDAALAAAVKWFGAATEVTPSKMTVSLALSQYLNHRHDGSDEGYRSTKSFLDNHVRPQLGDRLVAQLKAEDYKKWRDRTYKRLLETSRETDPARRDRLARQTTTYILKLFKAALNLAWESNRKLPRDEWAGLQYMKVPKGKKARGQPRMLVLSEKKNEPRRLLSACETEELRNVVAFMLLTGARPGEAYEMQCKDYDQEEGQWDVAASKTGPRLHTLCDKACKLLDRVTAGRPADAFVFVRPDGSQWSTARIQHPFKKAVAKAKLDPRTIPYTCRHSVISNLLKKGAIPLEVCQQQGTSLKMLQEHYFKSFPDEEYREKLESGSLDIDLPESNIAAF